MESQIRIDNLKCHGCANTIRKGLLGLTGVSYIEIDMDQSQLKVAHADPTSRSVLVEKLRSLGYPEVGDNSNYLKAKSYVSCAIGRMTENRQP